MMYKILFVIASVVLVLAFACSGSDEAVKKIDIPEETLSSCCPEGGGLLSPPINTGQKDLNEINNPAYAEYYHGYRIYYERQQDDEEFKDQSPFVEVNPYGNDPFYERLWFTSSRAPRREESSTNLFSQIYYADRKVDAADGSCPSEGWGDIVRFETGDELFDGLAKGAVTIAGDTMIVSADLSKDESSLSYYRNLWQLTKNENGEFVNPKQINSICTDDTWESQPTLSPCGRYLFFVSNKLNPSATDESKENNIYFTFKDKNREWVSPYPVDALNTPDFNEETPQFSRDGKKLYFSTDNPKFAKSGDYDICVVEFDGNIENLEFKSEPRSADEYFKKGCDDFELQVNTPTPQRYPHSYSNPVNKFGAGKAFYWSSDDPKGWGGFDIYGCAEPTPCITLLVYVLDAETGEFVDTPITKVQSSGSLPNKISPAGSGAPAEYRLQPGIDYEVFGGSTIFEEKVFDNGIVYAKWFAADSTIDYERDIQAEASTDTGIVEVPFDDFNDFKSKLGKTELQTGETNEIEIRGYTRKSEKERYITYDSQADYSQSENVFKIKFTTNEIQRTLGWAKAVLGKSPEKEKCAESLKAEGPIIPSETCKNMALATPSNPSDDIIIKDTVFLKKCEMDVDIKLIVTVIDLCDASDPVLKPIIKFREKGGGEIVKNLGRAEFALRPGKEYEVVGGSTYRGEPDCDLYKHHMFFGYREAAGEICPPPFSDEVDSEGKVPSVLTRSGGISTLTETETKVIYDTIRVVKSFEPKPPCVCMSLEVLPEHRNVAWFQTAFWEVNTSQNLPNHLARLEKGFDLESLENCLNGSNPNSCYDNKTLGRSVSDYYGNEAEPMFPVDISDPQTYSIANGRWIELHPNNMYWGVRPTYSIDKNRKRLVDRKGRIAEFKAFGTKTDRNLQVMADILSKQFFNHYITMERLSPPEADKVKLLVQVNAISDRRRITRGWYVGDTAIAYNSGAYYGAAKRIRLDPIRIEPPLIDEARKTIRRKSNLSTDPEGKNNKVLSELRAWFGYLEFMKVLETIPEYQTFIKGRKVFYPNIDCDVSIDEADVIFLVQGMGADQVAGANPYPYRNNYGNSGFYSYDGVRRVEISYQIVGMSGDRIIEFECCDPTKGCVEYPSDKDTVAPIVPTKKKLEMNEEYRYRIYASIKPHDPGKIVDDLDSGEDVEEVDPGEIEDDDYRPPEPEPVRESFELMILQTDSQNNAISTMTSLLAKGIKGLELRDPETSSSQLWEVYIPAVSEKHAGILKNQYVKAFVELGLDPQVIENR